MFEIDIEREFSAAHCLNGYKGNCAERHGHNWTVQAVVKAGTLDELGIAMDFKVLKRELDAILAELDHKDLNFLAAFEGSNPTSEIIAMVIFKRLAAKIDTDARKLARVRVCESRSSGATYYEG